MKVAIITWITYNNYGTLLQAYALQNYLKEIGIENEIISDKYIINPNIKNNDDSLKEKLSKKNVRRIYKYLFHPVKLITTMEIVLTEKKLKRKLFAYHKSQELQNNFRQNNLKILYGYDEDSLEELNSLYDCFICGSDQIWSTLDVNFNGFFYLNFVTKKKIAYAPSLGTNHIDVTKIDKIKNWISDFDALSIRERKSCEELSELTNFNIEWVVDPTLLFDEHFWEMFCLKNENKHRYHKYKYLLCYFLDNNEWYFEYAKSLAKYLNLKILIIPNKQEYVYLKDFKNIPVGPKEFVNLVKNASFVLTDSYHGSIFSLIFKKCFLCLKRFDDDAPNCQNIRINSLFEYLDITKNIKSKKIFDIHDINSLNYNIIDERIKYLRDKSREYLIRNLSQ